MNADPPLRYRAPRLLRSFLEIRFYMQRETIGVTVLSIIVAAILGTGTWMIWSSDDEPTDREPSSAPTDNPTGTAPKIDVPGCPISFRPGPDFERADLDRETPNLRVRSRDRGLTVDVSCKTADERFDRDHFLDKTLEAVRKKFGDDLLGERQFEMGEADGWTLRAKKEGTLRFVNVLIHERTIVLINVAGPVAGVSRNYNEDLTVQKVHWPGVH